jgi:basic membrane protein A
MDLGYTSAYAYDATGVLLRAIERVAVMDDTGNLVIGRRRLAEAVRATEGYEGVTGIISFDRKGDRLQDPLSQGCERGDLRVGLVTHVGGMADPFGQNTWEGLARADAELNVCARFIESHAGAGPEEAIAEFTEQDYDLIVIAGFGLRELTPQMAERFPHINFGVMDAAYDPPIDNVQGIVFRVDEAAFPVGYLAAAWAHMKDPEDPQVGYVAGMRIPPVESFVVAYEAGVNYYNQQKGADVLTKGVYVGDFDAPEEGMRQGFLLIDQGVDVIFNVGGRTGHGALAAAKERGKWGIGVDVDQYYTLSNERDILLTSCVKRLDKAIYSVVEAMTREEFRGGGVYVGTLANGGVGMAPFHNYEELIPNNIKQELEGIQERIIHGTIDTGWAE